MNPSYIFFHIMIYCKILVKKIKDILLTHANSFLSVIPNFTFWICGYKVCAVNHLRHKELNGHSVQVFFESTSMFSLG